MLDMTTTRLSPIPAWGDTLQRGDVVLFHFPCAEEGATEAPKSRTCLVLDIEMRDGRRIVELAYGTSAKTRANVGDDIRVETPNEMAAAGLRRPTRFVCSRRTWVALDHPAWDINPRYASPVIGRLSPRGFARMNATRAKIHALRDIAADRRGARRRPFTVEHRHRRTVVRPRREVRI